jgi:predicted Asp-tRNA(Asn)/Glu-tRNA(Gln) amidotransferase subunit C
MKNEKEANKLLSEFSKNLEEIPRSPEMIYVTNAYNVLRHDASPVDKGIFEKVMRIAPNKDKKGFIMVERTKL